MTSSYVRCFVVSTFAVAACWLSACSKSETSSDTTSSAQSSTARETYGGAASGGDAKAVTKDLCARLTAEQLSALLGQNFVSAQPMDASQRFDSSSTGPGCVYSTDKAFGLGGVYAELITKERFEGVKTDPVSQPQALAGVGDEGYAIYDYSDKTKVIRVLARKGDEHLFVQILQGTSVDKAKELANRLLGKD